jgi:2-C-methyl-D-erythritol 4-phosphate cytidylyltransferase
MITSEKVGVVIVAAGAGRRMSGLDKIMAPLVDRPVLARVLDTFQSCTMVDRIVVVMNEHNIENGRRLVEEIGWSKVSQICLGGELRQDSVRNGLEKLNDCRWVIIHDGARPLVTHKLIEDGLEAARETGAAVVALPVTDTIKTAGENLIVTGTPPRRDLWAVQTPQVFRYDIISKAYQGVAGEVTDDAMLVEKAGYKIKLYPGTTFNIKITTADDLDIAGLLWRKYGR